MDSLPSISATGCAPPWSPGGASIGQNRPSTSTATARPQHGVGQKMGRPSTSSGSRFESINARSETSWAHSIPAHMAPRRKVEPGSDSVAHMADLKISSPRGPKSTSPDGRLNPASRPRTTSPLSMAALHFHQRQPLEPCKHAVDRPETAAVSPRGAYAWDAKYAALLRDKLGGEQGLIEALALNPPATDALETDPHALKWFHSNFPAAAPSTRNDAIAVRKWVKKQVDSLKVAVSVGSTAASTAAAAARESQGLGKQRVHLSDDGRDGYLLVRDSEGFLSESILLHQEELFSRCMMELCGQVCSSCLERGHLMYQLWAALRHMLRSVLSDRESSRNIMRDARRSEQSAAAKAANLVHKAEGEKIEADQMCDVLNRRLMNVRSDLETSKEKIRELEGHLREFSDVHPDQMRNQIESLEVSLASAQRACSVAVAKGEKAAADLAASDEELQTLRSKMTDAKAKLSAASSDLGVRTPRPPQPKQPPWVLLSEEEIGLSQQALRDGCSAEDMHRLLVGVTSQGCNLLQWFDIIGCCRGSTVAELTLDILTSSAARSVPRSSGDGGVAEEDDTGAMSSTPIQQLGKSGAAGRRSSPYGPSLTPMSELYRAMLTLVSHRNVKLLSKCLSEAVLQRVSEMINHGVLAESMACLLLGTLSPEGFEVTPYRSLAGILAIRYNQSKSDVGGPITEALAAAAVTSRDRMAQLEMQLLAQHRDAVRLRREVKMQQRLEDEALALESAAPRKVPKPPHPALALLAHDLSYKNADSFEPLGIEGGVPPVLRSENSVYNRRMEKMEALRLARAILNAQRDFEAANNVKVHLSDFVYIHLSKKYGNITTVTEIAYNLVSALGQHMHKLECSTFVRVFFGDVEDALYEAQADLKKQILDAFAATDVAVNKQVTGWLCKPDFCQTIEKLFPEEQQVATVEELVAALDEDEPRKMVKYVHIFDEIGETSFGVFAETVLQQQLDERLAFLKTTEEAVLDQADAVSCTCSQLAAAIKKAHAELAPEAAQVLCDHMFGPGIDFEKASKKGSKAGRKSVPLAKGLGLLRQPDASNSISLEDAMEMATGKKVAILVAARELEVKKEKKPKSGKKKK